MITKESFRQKAENSGFSKEEISQIEHALESIISHKVKKSNSLSGLIKNFFEGYNAPGIWKLMMESVLIFFILVIISVLGYTGKFEPIIVSTIVAIILGFIFGKMR